MPATFSEDDTEFSVSSANINKHIMS